MMMGMDMLKMWPPTQNEQGSKRRPGVVDGKSLGWLVRSARERQSPGRFSPYNKSLFMKKLVPVLKVVHKREKWKKSCVGSRPSCQP